MRPWMILIGLSLILLSGGQALGQAPTTVSVTTRGGQAPLYGTSWGVASYGIPRTWTEFSSPYGLGTTYGHPDRGVLPGRFGADLWRPGRVDPPYVYGTAYGYHTWPYPYKPGGPKYGPSIGYYAPGFGPSQPSPHFGP